MRVLYPLIDPYQVHHLERDDHTLYIEECGNPSGIPILFLHGGPGSGCKPYHRSFFDPARYRIIILDQRGSGRSLPSGSLIQNTTQHLLDDLKFIQNHLNISKWVLFGGSWGAALALLYAEHYSNLVAGLVLRGTFLARTSDLDWFIHESGAQKIYPEAWDMLLKSIPVSDHHHPVDYLYRAVMGFDEIAQRRAARAWELWGGQVVLGEAFDPSRLESHVPIEIVHHAQIELHYAVNRYFIKENQILDHIDRVAHLPTTIIHGRKDLVCPVESAWTLHKTLPESTLEILPDAGHIASTDDMIDALIRATDDMATLLAH